MNVSFSEEQINYLQNYNIFIKKYVNNIENTGNRTNSSYTQQEQQQNQEMYHIEIDNFNIPVAMPVILPTTNYVYNGTPQDEATISRNEHIIVDYSDSYNNVDTNTDTDTNTNNSIRICSYNTKACLVLFITVCTLPILIALLSSFYIFID